MTKRSARRAPLTLEDLLLLLMRRLLIPVALTGVLFGSVMLLMMAPVMGAGGIEILLVLAPAAVVAVGLIFFGIPAGYAVSRLGWGLANSLALLAAIGFLAVELPLLLLEGYYRGLVGLFAAVTAAIWAKVNEDLFGRSDDDA